MSRLMIKLFSTSFVLLSLAGCVATGTDSPTTAAPPLNSLTFLDMKGFDSDLYRALDAKLPEVTVSFLDKPSPNKTPERVQKWLESLKQSGGQLEVVQPPNELAPKNPLALIGLLGSAWSSGKALIEINDQRKLSAIKGRDAIIYLQRSKTGDIIIDRIILKATK